MIPQVNEDIEVLERITAMRLQEAKAVTCRNYLTTLVDDTCRKAMVQWCFTVCDSFDLSRSTVGISMSILDRYICSGKGKSSEARKTKQKYQLATITSFYMAVKVHEPFQLGIEMLVKLCRGYYSQEAIFAMERDILHALEWRVCAAPTPIEYVRHFLELLPETRDTSNVIIENAMVYNDKVTLDVSFSTCKTSSVGIACFAGALNDTFVFSQLEKDMIWSTLSEKLDFDIASNEIRKVEQKLLGTSTSCEPRRPSRARLPRCSITAKNEQQPHSPVSVIRVA